MYKWNHSFNMKEINLKNHLYLGISGLSKLLDDFKIPLGGRFERFSAILKRDWFTFDNYKTWRIFVKSNFLQNVSTRIRSNWTVVYWRRQITTLTIFSFKWKNHELWLVPCYTKPYTGQGVLRSIYVYTYFVVPRSFSN